MKWEYLVEGSPVYQGSTIGIVKPNPSENSVATHLNLRGNEGWELVQISAGVNSVANIYSAGVIFIFKRPKP